MKITEFKNEDAIELLCDIIEPTAKILADKEMKKAVEKGCTKIDAIKIALKNNKGEIIAILAALNKTPIEQYECTVPTIIRDCLEIINDKELTDFFTSVQPKEE